MPPNFILHGLAKRHGMTCRVSHKHSISSEDATACHWSPHSHPEPGVKQLAERFRKNRRASYQVCSGFDVLIRGTE
jgi:hypothetical protein